MYARVIGTGSYLPNKILTNKDLEKTLDTSDEWIKTRSGIEARHIVNDDETTTYMAHQASIKALQMAGIDANKIGLIIVATTTADNIFPSCAVDLQYLLGCSCPGFDVQAVCSGFVYAIDIATKYIAQNEYILVVGAESMSRIIDWQDRKTAVLFGDGAAAVVLKRDKKKGFLGSSCDADGRYKQCLMVNNKVINQTGLYIILFSGDTYQHLEIKLLFMIIKFL